MNLIAFYKQTIKQNSQTIKESKLSIKQLMRENKASGREQWNLQLSQAEVRALYHLYAKLRNKDLSKIETNARKALEEQDIKKVEDAMLKRFENSQVIEGVV